MSKLEEGKIQNTYSEYETYLNYYESTSFIMGKLSVLYMMQALMYINDPSCKINIEKIIDTENTLLKYLEYTDVYTIFDIEFVVLQQLLVLSKSSRSIILKIFKSTNINMIEIRDKRLNRRIFR